MFTVGIFKAKDIEFRRLIHLASLVTQDQKKKRKKAQ